MRRDPNGGVFIEESDFVKTKRMKAAEEAEFEAIPIEEAA